MSRTDVRRTDQAEQTQPNTAALDQLITRVRSVVAHDRPAATTSAMVARALAPTLRQRELLGTHQQAGSPDGYRQHVLHVEPDGSFSVVALVWLPGQDTPIHDHVSWCAVGVYRGEETETRYTLTGSGEQRRLVAVDQLVNENGSATGIAPPGDIHRVQNTGSGRAISLHVYGADIGRLGSSIRRCYDLPIASA